MANSSQKIRRSFGQVLTVALFFLAFGPQVQAQTRFVTFDEIKEIAPQALDEFAQAIVDSHDDFVDAGITTRFRLAHFLAQILTETGGLDRIDENMNYSYKSLMRVFSRKTVSARKARALAGDPQAIANWVYGDRLGNNGRTTDDGWNYRGSGFIQLTGRDNFRARGSQVGIPFEESPELARQAREGLLAALAFWKAENINQAADDNDMLKVRTLVNGPSAQGLDQAHIWFGRVWNRVFREEVPIEIDGDENFILTADEEQDAFDRILMRSELLPPDFESAANKDELRTAAIKEFQNELGLPETGELDAATDDALHDPREWRHKE